MLSFFLRNPFEFEISAFAWVRLKDFGKLNEHFVFICSSVSQTVCRNKNERWIIKFSFSNIFCFYLDSKANSRFFCVFQFKLKLFKSWFQQSKIVDGKFKIHIKSGTKNKKFPYPTFYTNFACPINDFWLLSKVFLILLCKTIFFCFIIPGKSETSEPVFFVTLVRHLTDQQNSCFIENCNFLAFSFLNFINFI